MSDQNQQNSFLDKLSAITPEDVLSTIDGVPLPPVIKKNLWKSIGRLITGYVDVHVSKLDAKIQQIKSEADGLSLVTRTASTAAASEFGKDKYLIDRSVNHFAAKLLKEQINRENVVGKAIEDIKADPPKEDSKEEIDPDWLEMFSRVAETKSNEDVQLFLSKILAGEIRKPGTFSARTIQALSTLDQRTAQLFQIFCDVSFEVPTLQDSFTSLISNPFGGSPGSNSLTPIGLSYSNLTHLQDAGLIQNDLNSWRDIPPVLFRLPLKVGAKVFIFGVTPETPNSNVRVTALNFTQVGRELRKVIHLSTNPTYEAKFLEWVQNTFKVIPK